jgi:membrane associated rhomboid family serine protease
MAYRGGGFGFGFSLSPWVKNLIFINMGLFLLQSMQPFITGYMAFVPMEVLLRPWTIITYMFAHGSFWHLFWNMLALFFFGPPLESRWGSREFLKFYLICGLGGAALSFLVAPTSPIIGASAAVYGIMLAFAMTWPDAPIYIWGILPVKAKYLVGVLALVSFFSTLDGRADGVAHAAHLGGVVAGFVYLRVNRPGGAFAGFKRMMNRRKLKVVSEEPRPSVRSAPAAGGVGSTARRLCATGEEEQLLNELDRVLEKISTQGMSSLSPQERKLLDEVSQKYRNN